MECSQRLGRVSASRLRRRRCQWSWLAGLIVLGTFGHPHEGWCGDLRVQAVAGEPFGIAEISFPLDDACQLAWQTRSIRVEEATKRLVFPVIEHPGFLTRLASQIDGDPPTAPGRCIVLCFFTGDEPLEISVSCLPDVVERVVPQPSRPAKHARLGRRWWKQVWGPLGDRLGDAARPRPVENYVAGMGLWRFGIDRNPSSRELSIGTLEELLIGTSRLRAEASRIVSFSRSCDASATEPLPPEIQWRTGVIQVTTPPPIEEIALRVPRNCFYVRFGKYSNLLWATRLLQSQGEELQRLVTTRGYRSNVGEIIQRQLAIDEMPFADLIGDQLITDVALIGRDTYLVDGAAMGVILRSENKVLPSGLANVRKNALRTFAAAGSQERTIEIEGREVSFIATPDNRLRSFYVAEGEWHLIANSRAIVADFLRTFAGGPSLGQQPAFARIRSEIPPDNGDAVFAFISTDFMAQMASPAALAELQRRLRARAELQMLEIAWLAFQAESEARVGAGEPPMQLNMEDDLVGQLKSYQMLPPDFACRCDASYPLYKDGQFIDSLRGAAGTFLPIADVAVTSATPNEVRVYREFVRKHVGPWSVLDPLTLSMKRSRVPDKPGRERLEFVGLVAPLQPSNASILLGILGTPRDRRIESPADALVTLEAVFNRQLIAQPARRGRARERT